DAGGAAATAGGGADAAGTPDPARSAALDDFAPAKCAIPGAIWSSSPLIVFQSFAFRAFGLDRRASSIDARSICSVCTPLPAATLSPLASACFTASASAEKVATGPSNGFAL